MNQKYKKIGCIGLLVFIISLHITTIALAAESTHIIGDDPEKDLRTFDGEWLLDEFEDTEWEELDEDLNTVYKHLDDNWNNEKACKPLYDNTQEGQQYYNPENLQKYSKFDYADIVQVRVENLDKSNAKMVVQVVGDAEDADRIWILFLWSDCSGDKDNLVFIAIFEPEFIGGVTYQEYAYEYGDEVGNGTINIEDDGHNIEMEFDADIWDDVKDCHIRAMIFTPKHEGYTLAEDEDMNVDIFPGTQQIDLFSWLWLLLLIIAIIIALIVIYYLLKRRKERKGISKTGPRLKPKTE